MPPDVCSARTVLEASEPRVMEEPGLKVWPEMMYLGLRVWRDGLVVDGDWCRGVCTSGRRG